MKPQPEIPDASIPVPLPELPRTRAIKIFGVGGAGVALGDTLNQSEFAGANFAAIDTDAQSLAASSATLKIHLETKLLRGLGTGGDPERGHALAEEQFSTLKAACEGADVVFIVAGLGGGAGSGVSPVLARAAKESGALVLAFVTLPFLCERNRRQQQASHALEQLRTFADGVICLPNQKAFKLIDENTSVLDTFRITGGLLVEGIRGVWQLLTRPGLIQIHFDDLCGLVRDRHSESAFAFVETAGPARSREIIEKLLAHPLLDEGRALAGASAVLVSLTGGKDLTMAEVNRVMEKISQQCEPAQIIMGAAIDPGMANKLSVTLIAAKNSAEKTDSSSSSDSSKQNTLAIETNGDGLPENPRFGNRPTSGLQAHTREPIVSRPVRKRDKGKLIQPQLQLAIVSKGRFDKSEPTIHKGEDLDIPTYIRRGVPLN
ncbi:MAG TPA: cell division protein FtsZ [Candidatus Acidoferrum sp.]|jgi:cell division protein FtsZ|nr:cell division protein FtsZ [Candidatus Acidoferrum sp.]